MARTPFIVKGYYADEDGKMQAHYEMPVFVAEEIAERGLTEMTPITTTLAFRSALLRQTARALQLHEALRDVLDGKDGAEAAAREVLEAGVVSAGALVEREGDDNADR